MKKILLSVMVAWLSLIWFSSANDLINVSCNGSLLTSYDYVYENWPSRSCSPSFMTTSDFLSYFSDDLVDFTIHSDSISYSSLESFVENNWNVYLELDVCGDSSCENILWWSYVEYWYDENDWLYSTIEPSSFSFSDVESYDNVYFAVSLYSSDYEWSPVSINYWVSALLYTWDFDEKCPSGDISECSTEYDPWLTPPIEPDPSWTWDIDEPWTGWNTGWSDNPWGWNNDSWFVSWILASLWWIILSLSSVISEFIPYVIYIWIWILSAIIWFVAIKWLINWIRRKTYWSFR